MAVNHKVCIFVAISKRDSWSSNTDQVSSHFTRVELWFRHYCSCNDWKQLDWNFTEICTDVIVTWNRTKRRPIFQPSFHNSSHKIAEISQSLLGLISVWLVTYHFIFSIYSKPLHFLTKKQTRQNFIKLEMHVKAQHVARARRAAQTHLQNSGVTKQTYQLTYQFGPPQGSGSAQRVMQTWPVFEMTHPCRSFAVFF